VVADCLQERVAGEVTVLDRTASRHTALDVLETAADVTALHPAVVLLAFGGPEGDLEVAQERLAAIVDALAAVPQVVVVGVVPREAPAPEIRWNAALRAFAADRPRVEFVDPVGGVAQKEGVLRALMRPSGRLTDRGHAQVGAAVCAAVRLSPRAGSVGADVAEPQ